MHGIIICLQACLLWTQSACGSHIQSCDKTWKKRYDLLYKNPYFFVTTWPNQMGFSVNCRKIVIGCVITFPKSRNTFQYPLSKRVFKRLSETPFSSCCVYHRTIASTSREECLVTAQLHCAQWRSQGGRWGRSPPPPPKIWCFFFFFFFFFFRRRKKGKRKEKKEIVSLKLSLGKEWKKEKE